MIDLDNASWESFRELSGKAVAIPDDAKDVAPWFDEGIDRPSSLWNTAPDCTCTEIDKQRMDYIANTDSKIAVYCMGHGDYFYREQRTHRG